jgi:predicted aspartyl protease
MARLAFAAIAIAVASAGAAAHTVRPVSLPVRTDAVVETLPAADFAVSLTAKTPRSTRKKEMLRALRGSKSSKASTASLAGSDQDEEYLTDITIGGQSFKVIVDTGRYSYHWHSYSRY